VAIGNAFFRVVGCLAILPILDQVPSYIAMLESDPVRQVVNFHTAFNVALAIAFIGFVGPVSALMERLLPDGAAPADEGQARYLDEGALDEPAVALANARRETLRIADVLDDMLGKSMEALRRDDREYLSVVSNMDDIVDRLFEQTKLYLTSVSRHELGEEESRQCSDIMAFATNLEHIGDIIDKNLVELAGKKIKYRLQFSAEGLREIETMHQRVHDNLKLATSVFVSGDRNLARKLLLEKEHFRLLERNAAESHHERLKVGKRESIETSSLHLDILREPRARRCRGTPRPAPVVRSETSAGQLLRVRATASSQPL
jgi:phosphate:Na+ symporter